MRAWWIRVCLVLLLASAVPMIAQKEKRQTLTSAEIEKIRDAGIDPNLRISLYTDFLDERADALKRLAGRRASRARAAHMDDQLQDFTALMDELGSNVDQYGDRKADMRPALKKLNEKTPKWLEMLRGLPTEPAFDEARKEAIESTQDLAQDASQLQTEQLAYFKEHKDQKGQERAEPK